LYNRSKGDSQRKQINPSNNRTETTTYDELLYFLSDKVREQMESPQKEKRYSDSARNGIAESVYCVYDKETLKERKLNLSNYRVTGTTTSSGDELPYFVSNKVNYHLATELRYLLNKFFWKIIYAV